MIQIFEIFSMDFLRFSQSFLIEMVKVIFLHELSFSSARFACFKNSKYWAIALPIYP